MSTHTHDMDDTSQIFWPGYVDAISNLVLNLLFLVMILCLTVFVMSQNTQRVVIPRAGAASMVPHETQYEEARPDLGAKLSTGGKTDQVQKRAEIEARPSPVGKVAGAVRIQSQTLSDQGVYLEVHYLEDALDLSEASQRALRERMLPLLREGYTQWELVVVTDTAFASMRRSALLRILRVREALNVAELPGLKSNTRIDSGGTTASAAVVRLYGRRPGTTPATSPMQGPPQTPAQTSTQTSTQTQ